MKLIPYPHTNSLCESMQVNDVRFAFTNKLESGDYQLITNFVKCREYFNEFLMKNHHPQEFKFNDVYGFVYKYEEYPYNMSNPNIAIKLPKKSMYDTFVQNLVLLNAIEDFNDIPKTYVVETSDKQTRGYVFVLEFSPLWIKSCILFNIYTLLLKLCTLDIHTKGFTELHDRVYDYSKPSELTYVKTIGLNVFNSILNNIKELFKLDSKYVDGFDAIRGPYDIHGYSGLLAFVGSLYSTIPKDNKLLNILNTIKDTEAQTVFIQQGEAL